MARRSLVGIALGVALVVAAVLRFWELAANPGGLFTDEAAEAWSAHRILHEAGFFPVFFTDGGGREALFAYLVAGVFRFAGETTLALRATAAGIGVAGVVAIWALGRRFGEGVGLAAAAWAAGSLWLICISRDGMRNILVPLLDALAMLALLAWADRPTRMRASTAGALTALAALYTYQPLKLLPVLLILWLLWLRHVDRDRYLHLRSVGRWFLMAFAAVALPMAIAAASDPSAYFGRAIGVTPLASGQGGVNMVDHVVRTLGMFAITGDPNPRHDVAGLPLLGWPITAVAALGLLRLWRDRRTPRASLVLIALPIFMLPPLIATEGGAPHFLRSLGLAAPLGVTIGVGLAELVRLIGERFEDRWRFRARVAATTLAAAGLLGLGIGSGAAYLGRPVADRYDAYRYDLVAMAAAAQPTDAVILDDYDADVARFLDARSLPTIIAPGSTIPAPATYRSVLATSREDLIRALRKSVGEEITVIARHPNGRPSVYRAMP